MESTKQTLPCIVILTALSEEYEAVRKHIDDIQKVEHNSTIYEEGIFKLNDIEIARLLIRECGQTNVTASIEAERAIHYFKPDHMFFVGIAGSRKPNDFKIGDVIIAETIYSYEGGKAEKDSFQARPRLVTSKFKLNEIVKVVKRENEWKKLIKIDIDSKDAKADLGIIASGEKLIEHYNSDVGEIISKHYNDTQAVEMEGFGFSKVFERQGKETEHINFSVIRGISDIISRNESFQLDSRPEGAKQLASATAAAFTFNLIYEIYKDNSVQKKSPYQLNF